ncbi:MAG: hypothetical protein KAJ75_08870 [Alphaproteobacteria bacterium]|nr:hypothetical protein [Alphaproteobacteria bacterium]
MIRILNYIFIVASLVIASVWLSNQPGTVDISWLGFQINTSVPVLLIVLLVVFWASTLPLRFVKTVAKVPASVKETINEVSEARQERLKGNGYTCLIKGIAAIAAKDTDAVPLLKKAASLLKDKKLTQVLLAQSSELVKNTEEAKAQYEMLLRYPETELAAMYGLVKIAKASGDDSKALQMTIKAFSLRPNVAWISKELFNLQVKAGLMNDALKTLEIYKKENELNENRYIRLKTTILTAMHDKAIKAGEAEKAEKYIREASSTDIMFVPSTTRLAKIENEAGKTKKAVAPLVKVWKEKPHPEIAKTFLGLWEDESEFLLVQRAEQLAMVNKKQPESHLMVAKMAMKAKLWGQARKELDLFLVNRETTKEVAYMNAEFEEKGNQDIPKAISWFREAENCEPNETWLCNECNTRHDKWSATCPSCKAFASFKWSAKEGSLVEDETYLS